MRLSQRLLISGAVAERMRFSHFWPSTCSGRRLFTTPLPTGSGAEAGWLKSALLTAGGTVVHILSGVSGLVACIVIGKRKGYGTEPMIPHNLPMTVAGAALLWFGWFGFNAGSALMADGIAVSAFVVTHVA